MTGEFRLPFIELQLAHDLIVTKHIPYLHFLHFHVTVCKRFGSFVVNHWFNCTTMHIINNDYIEKVIVCSMSELVSSYHFSFCPYDISNGDYPPFFSFDYTGQQCPLWLGKPSNCSSWPFEVSESNVQVDFSMFTSTEKTNLLQRLAPCIKCRISLIVTSL